MEKKVEEEGLHKDMVNVFKKSMDDVVEMFKDSRAKKHEEKMEKKKKKKEEKE